MSQLPLLQASSVLMYPAFDYSRRSHVEEYNIGSLRFVLFLGQYDFPSTKRFIRTFSNDLLSPPTCLALCWMLEIQRSLGHGLSNTTA